MNLAFITWDFDPVIFDIGREIRYYGLTWALAFIVSSYVMQNLFKKDGVSTKAVDKLTFYIIFGTVIGARLGHVIFYNEDWYYFKNPLEIIMIQNGGLASHGAAIGIAVALYLYNRKYKMGYLWVMDRLVIAVAISGCLIRFGNLTNSEIVGKPTDASYGFVFPYEFKTGVKNEIGYNPSQEEYYGEVSDLKPTGAKGKEYNNLILPEYEVTIKYKAGYPAHLKQEDYTNLVSLYSLDKITKDDHIVFVDPVPLNEINFNGNKVQFKVYGIPRHASQLYESLSSLGLFFLMLFLFYKTKLRFHRGKLFGGFMVVLFLLRFAYEFSKEAQEQFEEGMAINMGQILSIIPILIGLYLMFGYKHYSEEAPVFIDPKEKNPEGKADGDT